MTAARNPVCDSTWVWIDCGRYLGKAGVMSALPIHYVSHPKFSRAQLNGSRLIWYRPEFVGKYLLLADAIRPEDGKYILFLTVQIVSEPESPNDLGSIQTGSTSLDQSDVEKIEAVESGSRAAYEHLDFAIVEDERCRYEIKKGRS